MSDTVTVNNQPDTIVLEGKEYPLAPLEREEYDRLEKWVSHRAWENAVESMRGVGGPADDEARTSHVTSLIAEGCFRVGTEMFNNAISGEHGQREVVTLMLAKANPDIPEQQCRDLVERQYRADWNSLWSKVQAEVARKLEETKG